MIYQITLKLGIIYNQKFTKKKWNGGSFYTADTDIGIVYAFENCYTNNKSLKICRQIIPE